MNKTRQAPSARRIIGMVVGVIIITFGPFIQFFEIGRASCRERV